MPVTHTIVPELSLVLRIYSGHVTAAELQAAIKATYADPKYREDMAEVDDLLDISFVDIGYQEALEFSRKAQEFHHQRGYQTPHFFVVTQAAAQTSVSMFEVFSEMAGATESMFVLPGYPEVMAVLDAPADSLKFLPAHRQTERDLL